MVAAQKKSKSPMFFSVGGDEAVGGNLPLLASHQSIYPPCTGGMMATSPPSCSGSSRFT